MKMSLQFSIAWHHIERCVKTHKLVCKRNSQKVLDLYQCGWFGELSFKVYRKTKNLHNRLSCTTLTCGTVRSSRTHTMTVLTIT